MADVNPSLSLGISPQEPHVATAYTLGLKDIGRTLGFNSASSVVVTVPKKTTVAIPVGACINISQDGAGSVTITAATGVTVNVATNQTSVIAAQYGVATLIKRDTDTWALVGNLTGA